MGRDSEAKRLRKLEENKKLKKLNDQLVAALFSYRDLMRNGVKTSHLSHVGLPHGWNGYDEFSDALEHCNKQADEALLLHEKVRCNNE